MAQVPSNLIPARITQLPDAPVASEDFLLVGVYNGATCKIRAGDLLQVAGVPLSRQVIAGTGLTGGGALSSNVTLSVAAGGIGTTQLAISGVTPGVYGNGSTVPQFTVDATGRVIAATSVPLFITTGVLSWSGGTTGLTPATATTGAVTLAGTLVVANGGTGATNAAGARTNLGLGTMAEQNATSVAITGGAINGATLGGTNAAAVTGTTITATSQFSGAGAGLTGTAAGLSIGGNAATATTATTAGSATTATTATNLAGGAAAQIPYQTGAGATGFVANGTAGQVLTSAGSSVPVWSDISGGTF